MRRAGVIAILVGGLVLAGCSNADGEDDPSPSPTPTDSEDLTEPEEPEEPTDADETDPDTEPTDAGDPTMIPDEDLPGEVVQIHPYEGGGLGVHGVEADDVLHVRQGPGVEFDSIAELQPLASGITATGHNRSRDDGTFWAQVEAGGVTGWASTFYLAYLGQTTDVTSELTDLPSAATLAEAGEQVAGQWADGHPPSVEIVIVDGPHEGDPGEIVLDVIGYGDDALAGERLHVFAAQDGSDYTVTTVEATLLCIRDLSDGLCL